MVLGCVAGRMVLRGLALWSGLVVAGCVSGPAALECPRGQQSHDGQCVPTSTLVFERCMESMRKTKVEREHGTGTEVQATVKGQGGSFQHERKDTEHAEYDDLPPELMGEDDLRSMEEAADFYGPLVDAKQKGNTIEYLGMATVDGDGAYKLKVTLKNGDIVYYYLDPETFLEFRSERQQFIRGSVREQFVEYGSYKPVAGVYMPFTMSYARRKDMSNASTVNLASIEANVPIDDGVFKMPAAPSLASPQKQPDPPAQQPQKKKEKTEPPKPPPH